MFRFAVEIIKLPKNIKYVALFLLCLKVCALASFELPFVLYDCVYILFPDFC